jgi:hypothetical protein
MKYNQHWGVWESTSKGEEGNSFGKRRGVLHVDFWEVRGELSARKSTNHVVLEGSHYWVVFMLEMWSMCL